MAEKKIPNWEKVWHSGLDYVAPGHEVGSHPAEQGNVTWSRIFPTTGPTLAEQFNDHVSKLLKSDGSDQFDIVHTNDYKQEPLPGEWLVFE